MTRLAALGSALAITVVIALSGCGTTAAPPAPGETSPAPAETSAPVSDISVYYPVALGNSWTYRMTAPEPLGIVNYVETMTAVDSEADGSWRVEITRDYQYENGLVPDFSDAVDYIFHPDGSITVPYNSSPDGSGSAVTVTSGEMRFPTPAQFESGTPLAGALTVEVVTDGQTIKQNVAYTLTGQGVESVTVPAGTYDARRLAQDLVIDMPDFGVVGMTLNTVIWLVEGVGAVRTEIADIAGLGASVTELVEFRPAP